MYFLTGTNTKQCSNIPEYSWICSIKSIKSFADPFVGIVLTFFEGSFNSFLFKSVFFTKLTQSFC